MDKWISVKDRLPQDNGKYLVCITGYLAGLGPYVITAHFSLNLSDLPDFEWRNDKDFNRSGWYNSDGDGEWEETTVTHWMPLPEPPKGG